MDDDYERVLSVKNEVFVYKIPPRQSSRGFRAADWKLDQPDWTGRMRIILLNNKCFLKLEDKTSGELFAQAPVDQYPGPAIEAVSDSSRYFVIKVVDVSGRQAFIGIGFADRGDSFDFNVTLQDHFKREKLVENDAKTPAVAPLDLGFKEGETIKINLGSRAGQDTRAKLKKPGGGNPGGILLPPPPSGSSTKIPTISMPSQISAPAKPLVQPVQQTTAPAADFGDFGDFASFSNNTNATKQTEWLQF